VNADLQKAYALISAYRQGALPKGSEVTEEQQLLIGVLCSDLAVNGEGMSFEHLVNRVAQADLTWNHRTQDVIAQIYLLRGSGKPQEAERERDEFIHECPSEWYRTIVGNL